MKRRYEICGLLDMGFVDRAIPTAGQDLGCRASCRDQRCTAHVIERASFEKVVVVVVVCCIEWLAHGKKVSSNRGVYLSLLR